MTRNLAFTILLLGMCQSSSAQDIARFCEQIRGASAERARNAIRAGYERYESENVTKDLAKPHGQQITHQLQSAYLTDYDRDCYLVSVVQVSGSVPNANNFCIGINTDYCFELNKKVFNSPWVIRKFRVTDLSSLDTQKLGFSMSFTRPSRWPKGVSGTVVTGLSSVYVDYSKLDTRPDTLVKAVTKNPAGMVLVIFETDLPAESSSKAATRPRVQNELTLDPNHDYLAIDFKQDWSDGNAQSTPRHVWDYEFEGKRIKHLISTQTIKEIVHGKVQTHAENVIVTDCNYDPIPAREFTLSAFGFPEPPGLPEHRTGWPTWAWALAVAAVCGVVVLAIRYRRSRSR